MSDLQISVIIPYKQRLESLKAVLSALADQTMDASRFEVVVGVLEYSEGYVAACREFADRLQITSVLADVDWNVGKARNMAMRQANGKITVLLDADMVLPGHVLSTLWSEYFANGKNVCVLGQALGYSCVVEDLGGNAELSMASVDSGELQPYEHYRELLRDLKEADLLWDDDRAVLDWVPMPWALVWSGLVALPTATIREHRLTFDEDFRGWGSEDQEWGYRIHLSGTPITLGENIYAMHLPHERDAEANRASYRLNSRYFLRKWPTLQVEVSRAFGWQEGNRLFGEIEGEMRAAVGEEGCTLGVVRGPAEGEDLLLVGAWVDAARSYVDADALAWFDPGADLEVLPLIGMALPYADQSVSRCRVLPAIDDLSGQYRDLVQAEATRVAVAVDVPARDEA
jgi:glycosyltransferase involved in cell wall biosynthesis